MQSGHNQDQGASYARAYPFFLGYFAIHSPVEVSKADATQQQGNINHVVRAHLGQSLDSSGKRTRRNHKEKITIRK